MNCLSVTKINITPGTTKFLWGLTTSPGIPEVPIQIYKSASSGILGPLNSIYVSFKVASSIPFGPEFEVLIDVGATGILEGSILTNLPSAQISKKVICSYDSVLFKIKCVNVGAFLEV